MSLAEVVTRGIVGSISRNSSSTEVLWEIERFFELPQNTRFCAASPNFMFRGQQLSLILFQKFPGDYITIFLLRKGPALVDLNQTVTCHFGLQHSDQFNGRKEITMEEEFLEGKNGLDLCMLPRSVLERERETLLPGGLFTFFCRLSSGRMTTVEEASIQTEASNEVLTTLSQNLKDLYMAKKHCDVTIKVKNETFAAHRAILGARTPVLEAMFTHDTTETETGVICVEDCDAKAFEVFLMFVYSGKVENLTGENVINVYYIADKYDVPQLKEECVRYMISTITLDTIFDFISVATRHGDRILLEGAIDFFRRNAQEIFLMPQWERFMERNGRQANELILSSFKYATSKYHPF